MCHSTQRSRSRILSHMSLPRQARAWRASRPMGLGFRDTRLRWSPTRTNGAPLVLSTAVGDLSVFSCRVNDHWPSPAKLEDPHAAITATLAPELGLPVAAVTLVTRIFRVDFPTSMINSTATLTLHSTFTNTGGFLAGIQWCAAESVVAVAKVVMFELKFPERECFTREQNCERLKGELSGLYNCLEGALDIIHHPKGARLIPRTIEAWVELRHHLSDGVTTTCLKRMEKLWRNSMPAIEAFGRERSLECPCQDFATNDDFGTHFEATHLTPHATKDDVSKLRKRKRLLPI
jgi:hypothetical protein